MNDRPPPPDGVSVPSRPTDGVLVIDKPQGPTSHDVVARVRRALRTREVGHAGTLDPMATGVLVVAIGQATRLVPWLTAHAKAYRATIRLGVETASLDAQGEVVETRPLDEHVRAILSDPAHPALLEALSGEAARTEQVPPAVSAIKIDGVAAHARTRRGEVLELGARPIAVEKLELLATRVDPPELDVEIACAKGYYVRSLARDLSARLGTIGHLVMLRRTRSGPFGLEDATDLAGDLAARVIPLAAAATRALGAVELTAEGVVRARHGKKLAHEHFLRPPRTGIAAWLASGVLIAIGESNDEESWVLRGFPERPAAPTVP